MNVKPGGSPLVAPFLARFTVGCSDDAEHATDDTMLLADGSVWTNLDQHAGVLEKYDPLLCVVMSLFVVKQRAGTLSWWETLDGTYVRMAEVGLT